MHCHSCFHVHAMATAIAIVLSVGPACRSAPTAATPVARPGQGSGGVSAAAAPQQTRLPEVDEMVDADLALLAEGSVVGGGGRIDE